MGMCTVPLHLHPFEIICRDWKFGLADHMMLSFCEKHSYSIQCISDILRQGVDSVTVLVVIDINASLSYPCGTQDSSASSIHFGFHKFLSVFMGLITLLVPRAAPYVHTTLAFFTLENVSMYV